MGCSRQRRLFICGADDVDDHREFCMNVTRFVIFERKVVYILGIISSLLLSEKRFSSFLCSKKLFVGFFMLILIGFLGRTVESVYISPKS